MRNHKQPTNLVTVCAQLLQGLTALQLAVCNGLTDVAKVLLDNESSSGPNTLVSLLFQHRKLSLFP